MHSKIKQNLTVYTKMAMDVFKKKPELADKQATIYLLVAIFLTAAIPALQNFAEHYSGISDSFLVLPFVGFSSGLAFYLFTQERIQVGLCSLSMLIFGAILGCGVVFFNRGAMTAGGNFTSASAVVSIFNQSVIIPFYEELTVRTFLFIGLARYLGFVFSAIVASALFGLVHGKIPIFAFFMSLLLCYLAYRNVGVFNRAIMHGSYNFISIIAVITFGKM